MNVTCFASALDQKNGVWVTSESPIYAFKHIRGLVLAAELDLLAQQREVRLVRQQAQHDQIRV